MENKEIMKEIENYVNKIEDNYYKRIISTDILASLQRKLKVFLIDNCERFGLSEEKIYDNSETITVLFNREKQCLDVNVDIDLLKEQQIKYRKII